ncbi:hypothetical protein FKG94_15770 [Exilibacterium tricleocarpae]|uniref:Uncharacterized protein n=1 Tax=Exilibacterium tricleocarpae TaxID=2591008 RepID=A0A545TFV8_9GAMM|nr:hypothetical protein [Exilibacterium tricleocarpae]TQV76066.1 hypothetical protein FKG94_15770 [Exilibacterium tricleocarpae]
MRNLLKDVPLGKQPEFLGELMKHYVDKQGLGGIPKPDLDALIIYLYTKYSGKSFDAFELGQIFMLKESRVKSLYETGLIKYSGITEGQAWIDILEKLRTTKFELESYERAQVKFKFENPALYKYMQKRLRAIGGTAPFSSTYETVTITLSTLFELLDHIFDASQTQFASGEMDTIHELMGPVIKQLGKSLGKKKLRELRGDKGLKTKAGAAIAAAANLAGIGGFITALLDSV